MATPRFDEGDSFETDFNPNDIGYEEDDTGGGRAAANVPDEIYDDEAPSAQEAQRDNRQEQLRPQRRGPRPGFMGQGRMGANDMQALVDNFWDNNSSQQQPQLSPQQEFYQQLVEKISGRDGQDGQRPREDDDGWNQFLAQRELVPTMTEFERRFNEAGNDPTKTQSAMRELMQETARATYRQVATDMQQIVTMAIQRMVPPMLQEQMQRVSSEQTYNQLRAELVTRNPHYGTTRLGPMVDQVLAQALHKTNGNSARALKLAENFLSESLGARGNNNRNNSQGGGTIDWSNVARNARRREEY